MSEPSSFAHCRVCAGALAKGAVLYFQRRPPGNDPNREGEKPALSQPPPWADSETRSATLDGLSPEHVLSMYTGSRASDCHREMIAADPRYGALPGLYRMLAELIRWHNHTGRQIALAYAHPCPHCGEHDPVGAIELIIAEPELIRALKEADDRPWLEYDPQGRLIGGPSSPEARLARHEHDVAAGLACPTCGKPDAMPGRFCRSCGHDRGRNFTPPSIPPPTAPVVARRERPPLMRCRACKTPLTPRAVFELEYKRRPGGMHGDEGDDDHSRLMAALRDGRPLPSHPQPAPDKWQGLNWIKPGGEALEDARATLAADPAWQARSDAERDLEARRRAAGHYLASIPPDPGRWTGEVARALVRPCRSCGEADPLGTSGPPSPVA